MIRRQIYIIGLLIVVVNASYAQRVMPASIFGSSMVLQQGIKVPVWGTAKPGQEIRLSFAGKTNKAKTDANGKWIVKLPVMKAGGPFKMVISSADDTVMFDDILIGEVWLASGQSNMQFQLAEANNAAKEIEEAKYPKIRFFKVGLNISSKPLEKVSGSWKACIPENARGFSAVAYFFARELYQDKNVAVGIISSSWGATPAEAWTSGNALIGHPDFKDSITRYQTLQEDWELLYRNYLKSVEAAKDSNNKAKPLIMPKQKNYPSALYNAMIAPVVPYGIKGVIWYQGEGNTTRATQYRSLFPLLINDWRSKWDDAKLPFIFVQLANFKPRNTEPLFTDDWASLREAQAMALKLPNTGMAIAIDVGDAKTIHPKNKQDVGKRLYLVANHIVYKQPGIYSGPQFNGLTIQDNKMELRFKQIGDGLTSKDDKLKGFMIAGADKKFYWADAEIIGDKVVVSSTQVSHPVAVRYAWVSNPECNLYNKEGLPAPPFRTDDW
ncbi:MAG: sialate O-acetylesterase [Mucilaginibacter sp.]